MFLPPVFASSLVPKVLQFLQDNWPIIVIIGLISLVVGMRMFSGRHKSRLNKVKLTVFGALAIVGVVALAKYAGPWVAPLLVGISPVSIVFVAVGIALVMEWTAFKSKQLDKERQEKKEPELTGRAGRRAKRKAEIKARKKKKKGRIKQERIFKEGPR